MRRALLLAAAALALPALDGLAGRPATADKVVVVNNYYGGTPFVYGGYTYLPLRNIEDALGAALLWDSLKHQAVLTYNGHELGLVVGNSVAYLDGGAVNIPVAPVIVNDHVFVPTTILNRCLGVAAEYDGPRHQLKIRGPKHWWAFEVDRHPKPAVVSAVKKHQGPPAVGAKHGPQPKHHGKSGKSKGKK